MTIDANIITLRAFLESSYGVHPGVGGVAIAGNKGAVSITPSAQRIERNNIRSHGSPQKSRKTAKVFDINITVEMRGAGITGGQVIAPEWDLLIRACGWEKRDGLRLAYDGAAGSPAPSHAVINTDQSNASVGDVYEAITNELFILQPKTSPNVPANDENLSMDSGGVTVVTNGAPKDMIVYKPYTTKNHESLTFEFNYDGVEFVAKGSRGAVTMGWSTSNYPTLSFTFQGLYAVPTDDPIPTGLVYVVTDPEPVEGVTFRLGGTDMTNIMINQFDLNPGTQTRQRPGMQPSTGIKEIKIGQQRTTSFTIDPEMELLATLDVHTPWNDDTLQVLSAQLGDVSGERMRVTLPGVVYDDTSITDDEDRKTTISGTSVGEQVLTDGDDEMFIALMEV
ncbi:MAG: hypothetical protein AAF512_00715 [Pseudomonadota bacterium]